jgi:hypothetical protein
VYGFLYVPYLFPRLAFLLRGESSRLLVASLLSGYKLTMFV